MNNTIEKDNNESYCLKHRYFYFYKYIHIYIYVHINQAIKPDGKKEQILSIFYITKAFLLMNLQSVTKIIFLQKII